MAEPTPTFAGEVQFRRYSDTSTQGTQIVLALPDREALQSFIGLEGKRFMAVLVQIGDDEQPVPNTPKTGDFKQREPLGDLCWRAVQWCKEPEFLSWLTAHGDFNEALTPETAANVIRGWCQVESRKELDTNPDAARRFNIHIRAPYQKFLIARGVVR